MVELDEVIGDVCAECRNWFSRTENRYIGRYEIKNGELNLDGVVKEGQYFRITGSIFADGVYQYPHTFTNDEEFDGCVWAMRVPAEFLADCQHIADWRSKNDEGAESPYVMESFGGYTYTKTQSVTSTGSSDRTWRGVFKGMLTRWRKIV